MTSRRDAAADGRDTRRARRLRAGARETAWLDAELRAAVDGRLDAGPAPDASVPAGHRGAQGAGPPLRAGSPGEDEDARLSGWHKAERPDDHLAGGRPGGNPGSGGGGGDAADRTGKHRVVPPARPGAGSGQRGEPPVAPVAVRTATGWRVGDEEVSDLTSAMVLADLLAAEMPEGGPPTPAGPPQPGARTAGPGEHPDVAQLQETVAQLEHALTVRVRVEQAIGVLAERHRLRPRQAFELLRSAARARGRRVLEVAGEVVDSATNPLLRIPEELARPPAARRRGRL